MQRILKFCVVSLITVMLHSQLVFAQDADLVEAGKVVFEANCAACHANGNNVINPEKTLKLDILQINGKDTISAITTQVTQGYGAMPAFGGRLSEEEITSVANYVLNQAKTDGW